NTEQSQKARELLAEAAETDFACIPRDTFFLWTSALLVETCSACGESQWCEDLYRILAPYRHNVVVVSWGVVCDGSISHFLGMLSAKRGRLDDAAEEFQAALEVHTRMHAEPLVTRTAVHLGELLLRRRKSGDIERATELLSCAAVSAERSGQAGYLARCRQLIASATEAANTGIAAPSTATPIRLDAPSTRTGGECIFRREVDFWTVAFDGKLLRLRRSRGLAFLELLLRQPGTPIHVLDMLNA